MNHSWRCCGGGTERGHAPWCKGEDLTEESFLATAVKTRMVRMYGCYDPQKGAAMNRAYVNPETRMVHMYGCYDVYWPIWCDWIWEELPHITIAEMPSRCRP